jgi:hypothetical protein
MSSSLKAGSMAVRREGVPCFRSVCVESVMPPPCPPCLVLHARAGSEPRATLPAADCCAGVRVDYSHAQSISVARPFPGRGAALPGEDRAWSVPKRGLSPLPWFTGFRCVVPPPPRATSLLCRSCPSPRTAVAGFLQTSPHGDALALDSSLASGILRYLTVNLLQGTFTPTLTPLPGVHHPFHLTAACLRFGMNPKRYAWAAASDRRR